jgi:3-oxosteroid 1-dehydrogenase
MTSAQSDESFDLVIVGSGGGGLTAALAAVDAGLKPVVVEKQGFVGGSTAMSGGVIWLPNNPLMRAAGVPDSHEDGLAYLDSVVGDAGPASSPERREAFLRGGSAMVSFLQRKGLQLVRCPGYSDYYDNRKGGSTPGRSIEGVPWDGHQLGEWHDKINPGMARGIGMVVKTNEVRHLPVYHRSPRSFAVATRVLLRTYLAKARGQDLLTNGMSLVGQLTKVLRDNGVPIWLDTPFEDLVVEDGRVTGVRVLRDGRPVTVRAGKGVLLSAGGFERNPAMRRKYGGDQPNEAEWTVANPGNTGEALAAAIDIGAQTALLDEAWWLPMPRLELGGSTINLARQYPGTIFVNAHGRRFVNESNSYVEIGKAMYANDAVPAWLVFDDGFRRRYPLASGMRRLGEIRNAIPGRLPKEWIANGWVKRADTVEDLARLIEIDPAALAETVARFNTFAAQGEDPDFHRGESGYNAALGDPGRLVNPSVGPLAKGPFYATRIVPSDVGTCGGVLTDEHARVLDDNDAVIPGLYAAGNLTATVMGRTYPGAGASIGNTMTFGYIAARHAAGLPHDS